MWQLAYLTLLYFCCQTLIVAIRHLLFATFIIIITMRYCCYYCCYFCYICALSFTSCDRTVRAGATMCVRICSLLHAASCLPFAPHSLACQQWAPSVCSSLHVTRRDVSSPAVHFSIFCCLTRNLSSDKDAYKKLQVSVAHTHTHTHVAHFFPFFLSKYTYICVHAASCFCASYLLDIIICVALSDTPARLSW